MTLLQPLSWVQQTQAQAGAWVYLSLPELEIAGQAEVLAIAPCPPIEGGYAKVVLGTFGPSLPVREAIEASADFCRSLITPSGGHCYSVSGSRHKDRQRTRTSKSSSHARHTNKKPHPAGMGRKSG